MTLWAAFGRPASLTDYPPSPASATSCAGQFTVESVTAADTRRLGAAIGGALVAGDLVVLGGRLGAGKTTLAQGIGEGLGVRGPITSPTFVICRIHPSLVGGPALVHVDAYRLSGTGGAIDDLDLESQIEQSITVVEWGAGSVEHLVDSWLHIELIRRTGLGREQQDDQRRGVITGHGVAWPQARVDGLRYAVTGQA